MQKFKTLFTMNAPAKIRSGGLLSSSLIICVLSLLHAGLEPARAQITTLSSGTSVAQVNPNSQAGMFSWAVQGQNQLAQQWFWYRIGNNAEQSIDTIGTPVVSTFSGTRGLSTVYTSAGQFSVQVDYLLTGGAVVGNGQTAVSDMAETITINNLSANPLDFHFFQYSDFDLGGQPGNQTVQLGTNIFGKFNEAVQSLPGGTLTETVTAPGADHGEVAFFNQTLVKLNNGVADNLNDNTGPLGPGDGTWALQWDFLGLTGSKIISKDKNLQVVVPEPSTWSLIAAGLAGSVLCAWRRRRSV